MTASYGTRGAVVKQKVTFGHLACASLTPPSDIDVLEITDEDETGWLKSGSMDKLHEFLSTFFPFPARFEKVWARMPTARGMAPLYIWRPVPHSKDYVPLGMIATSDDTEPPADSLRCVHKAFARGLPTAELAQLWADPGSAGPPAGVWGAKASRATLFGLSTGASAASAPEVQALQRVDGGRWYMDLPGHGDASGAQTPIASRTPREGSEERTPLKAARGPAPVKAKSCFRMSSRRDPGGGDKKLASVEHDLDAYRRNYLALKQAIEDKLDGKVGGRRWDWIGDEPHNI